MIAIKIRFGSERRELAHHGREAWAMLKLIAASDDGCTVFSTPAPRWSHYVFKLRGYGLPIETVHEMHGGAFPGRHARYVLRMPVEVVEQREAA
jgi:hypothetical protein